METIPKASSSTKLGSEYQTLSINLEPRPSVQFTTNERRDESLTNAHFGDDIPKREELMAQEMWDAVRQNVNDTLSAGSPPFSLVDFAGKRSFVEQANQSNELKGLIHSFFKKQTLMTMSSYLGDYELRSIIVKVPSI